MADNTIPIVDVVQTQDAVVSPGLSFNKTDLLHVLYHAGFVLGGSLVAYLLSIYTQFNFGHFSYVAIPVLTILLHAAQRFFSTTIK